jgi:hypothetical protein
MVTGIQMVSLVSAMEFIQGRVYEDFSELKPSEGRVYEDFSELKPSEGRVYEDFSELKPSEGRFLKHWVLKSCNQFYQK